MDFIFNILFQNGFSTKGHAFCSHDFSILVTISIVTNIKAKLGQAEIPLAGKMYLPVLNESYATTTFKKKKLEENEEIN